MTMLPLGGFTGMAAILLAQRILVSTSTVQPCFGDL
jgi:hypothetical protein